MVVMSIVVCEWTTTSLKRLTNVARELGVFMPQLQLSLFHARGGGLAYEKHLEKEFGLQSSGAWRGWVVPNYEKYDYREIADKVRGCCAQRDSSSALLTSFPDKPASRQRLRQLVHRLSEHFRQRKLLHAFLLAQQRLQIGNRFCRICLRNSRHLGIERPPIKPSRKTLPAMMSGWPGQKIDRHCVDAGPVKRHEATFVPKVFR